MKRGTDIYRVAADEVRCLYMSDQTAPLDARIVFKVDKNVAYLDEAELVSFGEGLVREQKVLAGGALSPNVYKSWETLVQSVEGQSDLPVTKTELSLRELLEAYGFVPPDILKKAQDLVADGESFGLTLVRTKALKLEDLIRGAVGPGRYFKPKNHVANDVGRALIAKQKITPAELKAVLPKHVREKQPLEEVLLAENLLKAEDLEKLEPPAIELPDYDQPVEFLVRNGKITRSELLHYTLRATKRGETAIGELIEEQKVAQEVADFAQRLHDCKAKLRLKGAYRLGDVLIERSLITEAQLIERLQYQVDHAAPLGALLVAAKMITPEQLVEALIAQDDKLTELARKEAKKVPKKVEPPPPPPPPSPPPVQIKVVPKKINWREGIMALLVLAGLGGMGLWQASQMNRIATDKPDPLASEPINPVFAFFAGDGNGDSSEAYYTVEDLQGEKKEDVEKAQELDPQYAEQVNRLGVTLKNQNKEVDDLLAGNSDLLPTAAPITPPPVEAAKAAPAPAALPGQQPQQPAQAPVAAIVPVIGPTTAVQAVPAAR
ncbi:MAG: hypothetical protein FJZ01_12855, partial [Candidatus Sericytochromatia bacterium]|nr:hypothetical protein [Candidatus Tanganyikabacteria bacterium]